MILGGRDGDKMKKQISMLTDSPLKSIILFALPIMASSMLQFNYSLVDNIIVGRYVSDNALAAVGCVGPINSFIIGAALGLTTGFTIPVAHAFGEGDKRKLSHYAGSSILIAFTVGMVIMVVSHLISPLLLDAVKTPDEIKDIAASYINILYYLICIGH